MSYEIQKGVPMPEIRWSTRNKFAKFPFMQMEIGDSFEYPLAPDRVEKDREYIMATASEAGRKMGKKCPCRRTGNSVRVWRSE